MKMAPVYIKPDVKLRYLLFDFIPGIPADAVYTWKTQLMQMRNYNSVYLDIYNILEKITDEIAER